MIEKTPHSTVYKAEYCGITYPKFLRFKVIQKLWKLLFCRRNMHLFDEVWSSQDHYLYCDACKKTYIFIDEIIIEK